MGASGVLVPPQTYFERVQAVLRRRDVLMIADEVICGFGRLGRLFGSEVYGIEPDLVTVAKGLTSGYFPLSAVILPERVWEVLRAGSPEVGAFAHGFTSSGHPVGAAAAMTDMLVLYVHDAMDRLAGWARNIVAASSEGDELRTMLAALRRLTKHEPVNRSRLHDAIAGRVVEAERYVV